MPDNNNKLVKLKEEYGRLIPPLVVLVLLSLAVFIIESKLETDKKLPVSISEHEDNPEGNTIRETEKADTGESEYREKPGTDNESGSGSEDAEKADEDTEKPHLYNEEKSSGKTGIHIEEDGEYRIYLATDLHYYASSLTDYGEAFDKAMSADDGKYIEKIPEITRAFTDECIRKRPDLLILSGDLTLDGERASHDELAGMLENLHENGIQVLVIPGNHDINNAHASSFQGKEKLPAEFISPEEFEDIYYKYGYEQAYSRAKTSLSYLYKLDRQTWFLMLDSSVYKPENRVYGNIDIDTLEWAEGMLKEAEREGADVIAVSHHNLLSESRYYIKDCIIRNSAEVIKLLDSYNVSAWFSGHLHLQRIKDYAPEPGISAEGHISEVVTGAFAMYPFPYGDIYIEAGKSLSYNVRETEVSEEIYEHGIAAWRTVIREQIEEKISDIPEEIVKSISSSYSELMLSYVEGRTAEDEEFKSGEGFGYMERFLNGSVIYKRADDIIRDSRSDSRSFYKTLGNNISNE